MNSPLVKTMVSNVPATALKPGYKMTLPFGRTATITAVKVGTKYVTLTLEGLPQTRINKLDYQLCDMPVREVHYNEPIEVGPAADWHEYLMSDCPMGCKVYRNDRTGELALAHNSNYNCYR